MMAAVRGRDTRPEIAVRCALHARGLRFRLHDGKLPGRPDIVLRRWNAVVLVHGCFWHWHGCGRSKLPGTRTSFWKNKIEGNVSRDRRNQAALLAAGWRVFIVWECQIENAERIGDGSYYDALAYKIRCVPCLADLPSCVALEVEHLSAPIAERTRRSVQKRALRPFA